MNPKTLSRIWVLLLVAPLIGSMSAHAGLQEDNPPNENPQDVAPLDVAPPVDIMPLELPQDQTPQDQTQQPQPMPLDQEEPSIFPPDTGDILSITPDEAPRVDKRLVGWQQAGFGTDGGRLSNQLRANWVMLNDNSGIDGRLVGVTEPATVSLLRGGFLVSQAETDEFGEFRFESASPGPYTIVGNSYDTFFAFGFNAVERNNQMASLPLIIEPLPAFGIENMHLIAKLIRDNSPRVRFGTYGTWDIGEAADDPAEFFGYNGLKYLAQEALPATTIRHDTVGILNDGRLVGRIHQINNRTGRPVEVIGTDIKIIQDGELIAETQTDVLGVFEIYGLAAGEYALVAVGADGVAVIGLDLVDSGFSSANNDYDPLYKTVSWSSDPGPTVFDALLSDPEATGWINSYVQEQEYERAMKEPRPEMLNQMPYDYFSQPGGGGGAGGSDFASGLGDLLLLGAFGVAIADAARTETFFGGAIPVVSPFNP